jgi:hypothetical protein
VPCHLRRPYQHRDRPARVRVADVVIDKIFAPNATDQDLIRVQGTIATDRDHRLLLALDDHAGHRQIAEKQHRFSRESGRYIRQLAAEVYREAEKIGVDRAVGSLSGSKPAADRREPAYRLRVTGRASVPSRARDRGREHAGHQIRDVRRIDGQERVVSACCGDGGFHPDQFRCETADPRKC